MRHVPMILKHGHQVCVEDFIHPVRRLIVERAKSGSLPDKRQDDFKLGLAIEGGGMRGVISGGMLSGLDYLGLQNVFDVVYGASAGSIAGGYFLSHQTPFGTTMFYEKLNNRKFIDLRRYFSSKPVLSLEFLLDHVMENERILDWKYLLSQPVPLRMVATSVSKLKAVALGDFTSREELWEAMRASARIPVVAGPPVEFRGDYYLDATVAESIPYQSALAEGCTHVLVIRTRPFGFRLGKPSFFSRFIETRALSKVNPGLLPLLRDRPNRYNRCCDFLEEKMSSAESGGPHIFSIFPSSAATVGRMEKDRVILVKGALDGAAATVEALTGRRPVAMEVIRPYTSDGAAIGPLANESIDSHVRDSSGTT